MSDWAGSRLERMVNKSLQFEAGAPGRPICLAGFAEGAPLFGPRPIRITAEFFLGHDNPFLYDGVGTIAPPTRPSSLLGGKAPQVATGVTP